MEPQDPRPAPDPDTETSPPLAWPPPGLARIQGDAYGAARWLAAGAILILPLLWSLVAPHDPWALSPLGGTLWLAFLLAIAGIPVLVGGYVVLGRLFVRASEAVGRGHHWLVVALTATDQARDTGFLLQGARAYRLLSDAGRYRLALNRLMVGALVLFAALWLSLGFGLSVLLAARGVLGPVGVAVLTVGPGAVAGLVAALAHAWEEGRVRKLRKRWFGQGWSQSLDPDDIRSWQAALATRSPRIPGPDAIPEGGGRARGVLRGAYLATGVATLMAFIPVFALVFSAAMIPVLARISVPAHDRSSARFAAVEPLRDLALDPDADISAGEAGDMLHSLSFVGRSYRDTEGVRPPAREYPAPWFPEEGRPAESGPALVDRIVAGMGLPLEGDELAYLTRVAEHPAHGEIARLARAGALDIAGQRWVLPLPDGITLAELSMPGMGSVRSGAQAHLARAAVQATRGDVAAADTTIREVLSVGLLMADESPAVVDNYVGLVLAGLAGDALVALYRNTGHPDADLLAWGTASAVRAVDRAQSPVDGDVAEALRAMPWRSLDDGSARGVRWEYVGLLSTLGPCMNLQRMVFGPDNAFRNWQRLAEASLVRYPSEAELFEVARGGLLGGSADASPSLSARVLGLTMGGAEEPGSCARVLGQFVDF